MSKKPLIGITFDAQQPGGYSRYPWYALRENYCTSIINAGGIPFPLVHELDLVESYLSMVDGLLITGGGHDVDPALYGEQEVHPTVKLNPRRTRFEIDIAQKALGRNLPVLGICGGEQALNVALGGTLIQHIPDAIPDALEHRQPHCRHEPSHEIRIKEGTLLSKIVGQESLMVNSVHHQAVKDPAPGVIVNAWAPDGVIEGIEAPAYTFCLGVQWHPEFTITPQEHALLRAFIEAARG